MKHSLASHLIAGNVNLARRRAGRDHGPERCHYVKPSRESERYGCIAEVCNAQRGALPLR
jgi:hypothetical protein